MKTLAHFRPIVVASLLFVASAQGLRADNGTYTNATTGGLWSDSGNWTGATIADGAGFTASFSADLLAADTVTLDTSRTIGNLSFSDTGTGTPFPWTMAASGGSVLTLATGTGTPTISVSTSSSNSTISAPLAGNQGYTKAGAGILIFKDISTASNMLSGEIHLTAGKLNLQNVSGGAVTLIRMVNTAVNFDSGTALQVGSSGGAGAGTAGLISTGTNGTVNATSNLRPLSLGGSGTYSFGGTLSAANNVNTFLLNVNMTDGGSQTLTNTANTYRGLNNINSGSLISASATLTGTPFSTSGVLLSNSGVGAGAISIAPTAGSGDVAYTGASIATSANNTVVGNFTYGNGAQLLLNKGSANSLSYTVGAGAAPSNSILIRSAAAANVNASNQGTLILGAASGTAALGTATGEKFIVNGGVPTINGIASASIIGRDGTGNKSGTFLAYDATNGFQQATYSGSTDINGGTAFSDTRVFDATGSTTNVLTADSSVYALRTSGQTVSGAFILSVGDSTAGTAGGVILNGGAINTSGLAFSTDAAGVIYASAANGAISAAITNIASGTTGRGVTFEGPGVLTLSGVNTFRGGAFINDSTVAITNDNQLGNKDAATVGVGSVTLRGGHFRHPEQLRSAGVQSH
jgi:autotransporter-associated beta strand protein